MSSPKHHRVHPLRLVGCLAGTVPDKKGRCKRLHLSTEAGARQVKVPKSLRSRAGGPWSAGTWLEVRGVEIANTKTGQRKYRASSVAVLHPTARPDAACGETPPGDRPAGLLPSGSSLDLPPQTPPAVPPQAPTQAPPTAIAPPPARSVPPKAAVLACRKSSCRKRGGDRVRKALEAALAERGLDGVVAVRPVGCLKQCKAGPAAVVMPDKTRYRRLTPEDVPALVDRHFGPAEGDRPCRAVPDAPPRWAL